MIKISQFICSFTFNKHVFNVVSFKKLATEHFIKNNKTKLNILLFLDDLYSPLTVLKLKILKIGCI